ncbi:hypothetical protein [Streptomyces triculaminicus]|uniref:hypothetical protein n=1 Tax=Streptomyces triculaminicus TaxID=2816232 RepID=UPI0037A7579B
MSDLTEWMAGIAAQPGPSEQRLDQLRTGRGLDDLTDAEAAARLVQVIVDYLRQLVGWEVHVVVGHASLERTGTNSVNGRLTHIVTTTMDQAQTLAELFSVSRATV